MKTLRSTLFVFAALLTATATQAQQTRVTAFIPFDFVVGDRPYSAGEYALKSLPGAGNIIQIDDKWQTGTPAVVLSNACQNLKPAENTKLVFRRMGGNYFLYQVWTQGNQYGREFPRGKMETMLAKNQKPSDTVIVAANLTK
jgi:hypothetical protein